MPAKKKPAPSKAPDPRFTRVVKVFAKDPHVTPPKGGASFGANALKYRGRIFAMLSSKGHFVAKLTQARVDELVAARKGRRFNPTGKRPMKEWIELKGNDALWLKLAREARECAGG